MKFLCLITFVLCCCTSGEGAIVWQDQPTDVHVRVGDTAVFKCNYTGTAGIPWWNISGYPYSTRLLPSRHRYSGHTLSVRDVELSDNSSTYQCFFLSGVHSTTGRLYCYSEEEITVQPTSSTTITVTTHRYEHISTAHVSTDNSTTVMSSSNGHSTFTIINSAITTIKSSSNGSTRQTIIVYGSIGCGSLLAVVVIIMVIILLVWKYWKCRCDREMCTTGSFKSLELELDVNPSYEQIKEIAAGYEYDCKKMEEEPHYEFIY